MITVKECENEIFNHIETIDDFNEMELEGVVTFEDVKGKWFSWINGLIFTTDHDCECCIDITDQMS